MKNLKNFVQMAGALSLSVSLAACQTTTGPGRASASVQADGLSYCERQPAVCVLVGAIVVGGVVAIASSSAGGSGVSNGGGGTGGGGMGSDIRLKTDVQFVRQLENGINLYAFRYTGDERVFVGVNAAEIRSDSRFAHAVVDLGNDFLGVDYQALGLEMVNEAEMRSASDRVVRRHAAL